MSESSQRTIDLWTSLLSYATSGIYPHLYLLICKRSVGVKAIILSDPGRTANTEAQETRKQV